MCSPKAKLGSLAENHQGKVDNMEYGERKISWGSVSDPVL